MVDNSRHTWILALLQKAKGQTVEDDSDIEEFLKSTDSYSLKLGWKGLSPNGRGAESESEYLPTMRLESIQAIVDEILVHFNVSPRCKFVRLSTPARLDVSGGIGEVDGTDDSPDFVFASSSQTVLRLEGTREELEEECSEANEYMRCVSFLEVETRGDASESDSDTPDPATELATYARYVKSTKRNLALMPRIREFFVQQKHRRFVFGVLLNEDHTVALYSFDRSGTVAS